MFNTKQLAGFTKGGRSSSFASTWLRGRIGLATCLAILCVSGPVKADDQVPFMASFVGLDFATFPDDCTVQVRHIDEGYATRLGRCVYTSTTITDTCKGGMLGHDDDVILTAANGDQLFGTSVDTSWRLDESGQILGESILTITGGTGRFANTTGTLRTSLVANLNEATPLPDGTLVVPNVFTIEGTLTSVGAAKK